MQTKTIIILSIIITFVFVMQFFIVSDDYKETWISVLIEMPKFILIYLGVSFTVHHFRCSRACVYIERFNGGDNVKYRAKVDEWLNKHDNDIERLADLKKNSDLLTIVKSFANLFQELGVAYKYKTVDKWILEDNFDVLIVMYWQKLKFFIIDYRNFDNTLYHKFEMLYDIYAKKKMLYLFSYGSLMNTKSAKAVLSRKIKTKDLIIAKLENYERVWNVKDKVYSESLNRPTNAVFLNIEEVNESKTKIALNGVLIRISMYELDNIKLREKNYNCINVNKDIIHDNTNHIDENLGVFTFVGKQECITKQGEEDIYVMQKYIDKLCEACDLFGSQFTELYNLTTRKIDINILEGSYKFDNIQQAKLV